MNSSQYGFGLTGVMRNECPTPAFGPSNGVDKGGNAASARAGGDNVLWLWLLSGLGLNVKMTAFVRRLCLVMIQNIAQIQYIFIHTTLKKIIVHHCNRGWVSTREHRP